MNILSPIRLIQNTYMRVFDSITMLDCVTNNTLDFNYFNTIYFLLPLQCNEPLHDRKMSFHVMTQGLRLWFFQKSWKSHSWFIDSKVRNVIYFAHTPLLRPKPSRFERPNA